MRTQHGSEQFILKIVIQIFTKTEHVIIHFHQSHYVFQVRATHQTTTIQKSFQNTRVNFLHPNKFYLCTLSTLLPKVRCLLAFFHFKQTAAATKQNQPKEAVYEVLIVVSRGGKNGVEEQPPIILHRHHCIYKYLPNYRKTLLSSGLQSRTTPAKKLCSFTFKAFPNWYVSSVPQNGKKKLCPNSAIILFCK